MGEKIREKMLRAYKRISARDVTDIRFLDEEEEVGATIGKSYPHCHKTSCIGREGGGLYCKNKTCRDRWIFCSYEESIHADVPQEDVGPPDVAKERWEWQECGNQYNLMADGKPIAMRMDANQPQMLSQAAAPQMLEKLEEVAKGAGVIEVGGEAVIVFMPGLLLGINELIKKARGGE